MRMRARLAVGVAGMSLALGGGVCADEVTDQLDAGRKAYEAGSYRESIQELQYAIVQIQEKLNEGYKKLIPGPLPGWRADGDDVEVTSMGMMGGGTQMGRTYYPEQGSGSVEVQIIADSPMIQAMAMMIGNPMMMQSDADSKPYRHGKYRGVVNHSKDSSDWEVSLMVANRVLVQVSGNQVADIKPVEGYLEAIDFEAIEAAFSN